MTPINVNPIAGVSQLAEKAAPRANPDSLDVGDAPESALQVQASPDLAGREQALDLEALSEATERLQQAADLQNRSLQFKLDAPNDSVQVLVIDRETEEVIREIPPTEVLEIAERIQETLGLVFDTQA